jgi:predicted transcriptional regulator
MSTNRARIKSTTPQLAKALEYRGLLTRVANRLGLSHSHVSRVAHGHRNSRRILQALLAEIERIERRAA